ncbi:MAG: serine hydrolase [Vallitaleaceae bacterium]|nr:serine hydrolase [Vallitaleaceae bacterium]
MRNEDLLKLEGIDQLIEDGLKEWRVPGLAVAVVKDGELLFSNGYGFRDPEKGLKMNADTRYRIASNTKAFVSTALSILVDEGKLDWDKPVRHYIPYFRLKDSYATENVTPRDLLCHRTGLPAHDGALHDCKTRKEMVENLQYLEASYPIRTKLQYNNLMYMTAGHLVDCISGQSWESFAQERIFKPLAMEKTNFSFAKSRLTDNFAECFYLKNDELRQYKYNNNSDPEYIYPRSPAGGINTTVNEIANWMIMQLNKGEFKGNRVVSENAFSQMHSPQMIDNWNSPYDELGESSCGLGWFIWAYRGEKLVVHGGFFGSQVYLLPKRNIGIAVFPTLGSPLSDSTLFNIIDRLLGLNQIDWTGRYINEREEAKKKQQPEVSNQIKETTPSHALEDYCGEFFNQGYGKFLIEWDGSNLFHKGDDHNHYLRHFHYDSFELLEPNGEVAFKITFNTDAKGVISSISVPFEPAVKDIIFTRSV